MKLSETFNFRLSSPERAILTILEDIFEVSEAEELRQMVRVSGVKTGLITRDEALKLGKTSQPGRPTIAPIGNKGVIEKTT
jgi:hypothetical protein